MEILEAAWELAREHGLAQVTLRDVAARIGMRAPSLYSHFASKHAIYDAMFAQAWTEYSVMDQAAIQHLPRSPRAALKYMARTYFDFSVSDLARHQLMDERPIPGFTPSPEAYAPSVELAERLSAVMEQIGIRDRRVIDLYTALIAGMISQQLSNDPGGDRWSRLLDDAIDMFADHVGLPPERSS